MCRLLWAAKDLQQPVRSNDRWPAAVSSSIPHVARQPDAKLSCMQAAQPINEESGFELLKARSFQLLSALREACC